MIKEEVIVMENTRKENRTAMKKNEPSPENTLGQDPDEQAMNGLYGMLETEEEDRANDRDGYHR